MAPLQDGGRAAELARSGGGCGLRHSPWTIAPIDEARIHAVVNTRPSLPIETRMALSKTKLEVFELGTQALEALAEAKRLARALGDAAPVEVAKAVMAAPGRRAAVLEAATEEAALACAREALAEAQDALDAARGVNGRRHQSGR